MLEDWSVIDILMKLGAFIAVQGLIFLIFSRSSSSFKIPRSLSINRWAASLADIPAASDSSPTGGFFRSVSCLYRSSTSRKSD